METLDESVLTLTAAAAGTIYSPIFVNPWGKGVSLFVNSTVNAGSYVVNLLGYDPISGTFYTIASSAALTSVAFSTLTVYPGITVAANVSVSAPVPRRWAVSAVITTGPITATIGAAVLL